MKPHELKPCPFCGGKANIIEDPHGWWFAECCGCASRTGMTSREAAALLWNRRVGDMPESVDL